MTQFAEIVFNLPVDRVFHYEVPAALVGRIQVGSRIRAPFREKDLQGYCVGFVAKPEIPFVRKVKEVLDETPTADARLLKLTRWMADRYVSSWGEAIFASIPGNGAK